MNEPKTKRTTALKLKTKNLPNERQSKKEIVLMNNLRNKDLTSTEITRVIQELKQGQYYFTSNGYIITSTTHKVSTKRNREVGRLVRKLKTCQNKGISHD